MHFPKWKYHAEKKPIVVPHQEAEDALGHGWADSPAHVKAAEPVASEKLETPAPVVPGLKRSIKKDRA